MKAKFFGVFLGLVILSAAIVSPASAGRFSVTVKNLTHATWFTPLLISAHDRHTDLFETGEPATAALQAMAEGGVLDGLLDYLDSQGAVSVANPAGGLLAPGASTPPSLFHTKRFGNRYLSIVAMLLPTNDGFVGMDSVRIPSSPGTYTYYLNGYDAGTEANDELVTGGGAPGVPGIPADPGGFDGTGGTGAAGSDANPTVHIHRGVVGDSDPDGGISDLDSTVHRWLNPVAEVTVTVHRRHRR